MVMPQAPGGSREARPAATPQTRSYPVDEISITIAFALLGLTWLTLRGMDGRESRRHRR